MHMTAFAQPQLLVDKLVVIGSAKEGGIIQEICPGDQESRVCSHFNLNAEDVVRLKEGELLCPGFVDLHVHAPQVLQQTALSWTG